MAWKAIDRNTPVVDSDAPPILSDGVRDKIRSFFPKYENKRAVLLPALHIIQHALGHVPYQAMVEVAKLLEIHPSDVIDTISFYTHFWTHPKGRKVVTACRSLSCELMGGAQVLRTLKDELGISEHETTADGAYSLVTEECLAGCDHAPCLLINEKLHKRVRAEDVVRLLADGDNDKLVIRRSELFDAPPPPTDGESDTPVDAAPIDRTSNIAEMKEGS